MPTPDDIPVTAPGSDEIPDLLAKYLGNQVAGGYAGLAHAASTGVSKLAQGNNLFSALDSAANAGADAVRNTHPFQYRPSADLVNTVGAVGNFLRPAAKPASDAASYISHKVGSVTDPILQSAGEVDPRLAGVVGAAGDVALNFGLPGEAALGVGSDLLKGAGRGAADLLAQYGERAPMTPEALAKLQQNARLGQASGQGGGVLPMAANGKTMDLYHWSNHDNLPVIDPAMYGTGIKGAEASRVLDDTGELPATPLRSYYYDNPKSREPGLGANQYKVRVSGIYDAGKDPMGLFARAEEKFTNPPTARFNPGAFDQDAAFNWFENQVKKSGYTGIHYPDQNAAVVFRKVATDNAAPAAGPRVAKKIQSNSQYARQRGAIDLGGEGDELPPEIEAAASPGAAEAIANKINTPDELGNKGISYHPATGNQPQEGHAVSLYKEREHSVPGDVTPTQVQNYINDNRDIFAKDPSAHFGAWYNPKDGKTYLDISSVHPDRDTALHHADLNDQDAIFDFANKQSTYLKDVPPHEIAAAHFMHPEDPGVDKESRKNLVTMLRDNLEPDEFARLKQKGWLDDMDKRQFDSDMGISTNPDEIAAMAHAGLAKKGWYENSAAALRHIFQDDAPRFGALLSAFSPQTSVEDNLTNALRIWKAWNAEGRPQDPAMISHIMGQNVLGDKGDKSVMDAWRNNGIEALTHPDPANLQLSGPKVNSFAANLRGELNKITNDSWQALASRVPQTDFSGHGISGMDRMKPTGKLLKSGEPAMAPVGGEGPGYLFQNAQTRAAAKKLTEETGINWTPANVQEGMWSYIKTLVEARRENMASGADLHQLHNLYDDKDIGNTPDFGKLLKEDPNYSELLRDAGYGHQLDTIDSAAHVGPQITRQSYQGEVYRKQDLKNALAGIERDLNMDPATKLPHQMPAFQKWNNYGGIKPVSREYRQPLDLVHATHSDFDAFDPERSDFGVHLGTPDASNARVSGEEAAGAPRSMPVYARIKNPIRLMDNAGQWQPDRMAKQMLNSGVLTPAEYNSVDGIYKDNTLFASNGFRGVDEIARKQLMDLMKKKGYDAVSYMNRFEGIPDSAWAEYLKNNAGNPSTFQQMQDAKYKFQTGATDEQFKQAFPMATESYMVWDPTQIKSKFNRGTWSPTDPHIGKAAGGLVKKYADGGQVSPDPAAKTSPDPAAGAAPRAQQPPPVPRVRGGLPKANTAFGTRQVFINGRPYTVSADPEQEARAVAAFKRLEAQQKNDALQRQKQVSPPAPPQ